MHYSQRLISIALPSSGSAASPRSPPAWVGTRPRKDLPMHPRRNDGNERISRDEIRATIAAKLGCPAADVTDHDDLIQLGLNSIRRMAMAGGWRKRGADITFAELAATPTVDSWYLLLSAEEQARHRYVEAQAEPAESTEERGKEAEKVPFSLATMQHAYWIGRAEEQELGGVAAHLYVEFDGIAIDPVRLEHAVAGLVETHPMLRTRFLPD